MLVVLALHGCGSPGDPPATTEVKEVVAVDEPAGLRIATAPDPGVAARAPVIETPLPSGAPIVRMRECFGYGWDDDALDQLGYVGPSTGRGGGGIGSARPSPRPTGQKGGLEARKKTETGSPPPPALPRPDRAPAPAASGPSASAPASPPKTRAPTPDAAAPPPVGGLVGGLADDRSPVAAKPAHREAEASPRAEGERSARDAAGAPADALGDKNQVAMPQGSAGSAPTTAEDRARAGELALDLAEPAEPDERAQQDRRALDWGATVYLSNDDSMSLASAQRVLYALSRGVRIDPSEVRPHELLNYFSFDTVAPPEGQTFGVLGAAEQQGDTLTVSLAVTGANPPRQPLDLTVLLDRSCSMTAEDRMGYTRRGLGLLADNLQRGDRVDVVLFDSGVCTPLENFVVGRDDPQLLRSVVQALQPTTGTNLDVGLKEAYRVQTGRDAADTHGRNRRVLLVTDALLNEGNVDQALVSEVGTALDQHGIRLSGVGVGRDFNDEMLDLLTEKGRGAYVYLGSDAVVDRVFGPGFDALVRTVAHDVQFSLDLPDSLAMERFYGEEASTDAEEVDPIHYHAGTTQLFLQDLKIRDGVLRRDDPVVMRIAYREATTMEPRTEELHTTVGALLEADPHNLRKARALMAFSDWTLALALGSNPCGAPLSDYRGRSQLLGDDAEIGFVNGLVGNRCGVALTSIVEASGVELKVKVDADIPIARAQLSCAGRTHVEALSGSDTVARFTRVQPGLCVLELDGTTPMAARVEVPSTGADLRCLVRGGRVSCG